MYDPGFSAMKDIIGTTGKSSKVYSILAVLIFWFNYTVVIKSMFLCCTPETNVVCQLHLNFKIPEKKNILFLEYIYI